ncbi:hypothetical protein [Microbacterium sp. Root553]|uniref:hypothetical protein n=1 Tax=Microbacterium sp. Root553 TaxID=1736556 RepID=UPI0006FDFCF0|nr:hypothetical protein [Microbacterium sp. Root553]KQZ25188.1 hypothetical protein ASD43_13175 [Microbacterium sp. Root553]
MTESRKPAVVRGFAASSLAIFIALAGHLTGGGAMPGPLGIVVPWLLSVMICVLLAGRRLSLTRMSLSVALSQFLFHVLFVLGTVAPSGVSAPHVHGGPIVIPTGPGISEAVVADGSMWIGHGIAALVTVLALHRGERLILALHTLSGQAVRWMRRRLDAALVRPALPALVRTRGEFLLQRASAPVHLTTLRGRAPPAIPAI